jgi:hypothetical protein
MPWYGLLVGSMIAADAEIHCDDRAKRRKWLFSLSELI